MPIIAAATGAGIAGVTGLVGTGVSLWYQNRAQAEAKKEHSRTEALNIKFAKEETKREDERFKKNFGLSQSTQNFNASQAILGNIQNLFESNRKGTNEMMTYNRTRRVA